MFKRLLQVCLISCLFLAPASFAFSSFKVQNIEVKGAYRVGAKTTLTYVPVQVGQTMTQAQASATLKALYKTGFFKNVQLYRSGNTLVIQVQEAPTIALINIYGNKAIPTSKLRQTLTKMGIAIGNPYNPMKLHQITVGLEQQYDYQGRHNASVDAKVVKEPRNRVALQIHIDEGAVAIVRQIKIIGNHHFSQRKLLSQFSLSTPSLFSFLTHNDRYSKAKLDLDLNKLQEFYMNHGYIRYRLVSKNVRISDDRKDVTITLTISEGPQYRISGYRIDHNVKNAADIRRIIRIKKGEVFSREKIIDIDKQIGDYYADRGYAFPKIQANPTLDDANHTVFITFSLQKGNRVYVRRIEFAGNGRTEDYVLRSRMRQLEASEFSLKQVKESKRRLAILPYLKDIQATTAHVPGKPDQVDLHYHVTEVNAGRASLQGGYSSVEKFVYGASVSEPNFMGSGKYVSLGFNNSSYQQYYSFQYNNPFYTVDGISRGYTIYYTHTNPGSVNLEPYKTDQYGGSLTYGIPISEYNSITAGAGYDHIAISNVTSSAAPTILNFLQENNSPFYQLNVTTGFNHNTLNRAVFPTSGSIQTLGATLGAPLTNEAVGYYKLSYNATWYWDWGHGFVLSPHADLGYGNGVGKSHMLPFYNNFYAGGLGTVPGFGPNTLGPKNPNNGNAALGGNVKLVGGVDLIIPNPFSDKIRISGIFDAGNVFETNKEEYSAQQQAVAGYTPAQVAAGQGLQPIQYEAVALKNLRMSAGIMLSWYSPLGLVNLSVSQPLNKKKGDDVNIFGFSFGTSV